MSQREASEQDAPPLLVWLWTALFLVLGAAVILVMLLLGYDIIELLA